MSIDRSLKSGDAHGQHRNVLTRAERIQRLSSRGRFDVESGEPLGLPKVANRKVMTGKKTKKKGPEEEEA